MKPLAERTTVRARSIGVVGASRKIRSRPFARAGVFSSPASSGGKIDYQQRIDSGARGIGAEPFASVMENRIEVTEQDERNFGFLAQLAHHRENRGERRAGFKATLRRALIGRPVSHRIRKRHAQFDEIGSARLEFAHQRRGRIQVGVARDHVWNQRAFIARA